MLLVADSDFQAIGYIAHCVRQARGDVGLGLGLGLGLGSGKR